MNKGKYVFSQLCDFLPHDYFKWLVKKYNGDKYVKKFSCWNHLLVMLFGQLSHRESLRDLTTTLSAHDRLLKHMEMGSAVSWSNLSKANEIREVVIFEYTAKRMIETATKAWAGEGKEELSHISGNVYAFDSSTIVLCLEFFWWCYMHDGKGGVKLHTLYDVNKGLPVFNIITQANVYDRTVMSQIPYEQGAFYVFDRGYFSLSELMNIDRNNAFFVVREKHPITFKVVSEAELTNIDNRILTDQRVIFNGHESKKKYTKEIRRTTYYDVVSNQTYVYFTNNFEIAAMDIAILYKNRWQVELFFKWMKQHLRIKEFYGTSENAVKIQLYTALTAYCLVALVKKTLSIQKDTYEMLRILTVSLFVKTDLKVLFEKQETKPRLQNVTELNLNLF